MHASTSFLAAAAFLPAVFAHYNFEALIVNGNITDPYEYVRKTNNSNSPITDITSTDLRCNSGGLLADTMAGTSTYTVAAGDNVGFTVDMSLSHPGPLSVWLSKAPEGTAANEYDGSGDWFKVYELTYYEITDEGIQWATYPPGTSGLTNFTLDLPSELPAGEYLMRAEHVALHAAEEVGGAQYYMGCAQLSVTGSGSGTPSPTTLIPGQYEGTEDGLVIDIYFPIPTNYTAPGISTWPEACVSHWPNLEGQTYYGLCYNSTAADNTTSTETGSVTSSGSSAASSASGSAATGSAATGSAATGSAATGSAASGSAASGSAAASSVVAQSSAAASTAAAAAPTSSSSSSSSCEKRRSINKRSTKKKGLPLQSFK